MRIKSIKATRGPNFWSVKNKKLMVCTIDAEDQPVHLSQENINHLRTGLKELFPGIIYEPILMDDAREGVYSDIDESHIGYHLLHTVLALQKSAGMAGNFGLIRNINNTTTFYVVFPYHSEDAGEVAIEAAEYIVRSLLKNKSVKVQRDIEDIKRMNERVHLGPSTEAIVGEAVERGIPFFKLPGGFIQLGYGSKQKRLSATITGQTSHIAVDIAGDKDNTKKLLDYFDIPVPKGTIIYDRHELYDALKEIGYPVVIKPLDGNQGKGATINVTDYHCALGGLLAARKYSKGIIVEKFIQGDDYRLLVINNKFVAAAKRTPAMVIGDGKSTIKELIDKVNEDPRRGDGHCNYLTKIKVDAMTRRILEENGYDLNVVLEAGEELRLKDTANLSTGGTSEDVTDIIHPDNIFMAEQIAQIVGLDVCGIDLMTSDITRPVKEVGGAVLEVNAAPGFRMHTHPATGKPRNVAKPVVDMLFPEGSNFSIPIVAVTGTNGKTTTTRLIAHIAKTAGYRTGYTNTDGIYVHEKLIQKGDSSGPNSAEFILKNPSVDFAVLESARGGILRSGLAFQQSNVGVVLNVAADHLGIGGIDTLEELARVKAVVAESVMPSGYAVLNADDELVADMAKHVKANIAYFSRDPQNAIILRHCARNGVSAVEENGMIKICEGRHSFEIAQSSEVPITLNGRAGFMIENVLAAVLAAYTAGIEIDSIREGIKNFRPSSRQTPGRLNFYKFEDFELLIDFAHNPAGIQAVKSVVDNVDAFPKVGIFGAVGDRRNEDIIELGKVAGSMFDEIIIRQDKDLRGRTAEEITALVKQGIELVKQGIPIMRIDNEVEALKYAIKHAKKGSFITLLSDKVMDAIEAVEEYEKELESA
jgi:cyanophycin synthetase